MSDQSTPVYVVHFPHPGREHPEPPARVIPPLPWRMEANEGEHGRKFMRSPGRYVDRNDVCNAGELTFWGEWEAPSDVVHEWPASDPLPRFLHIPVWEKSGPPNRQNTDPWVFGDYFRYSNCKQMTVQSMQRLTPGSVIFFGSKKNGEFVLDTVFVVKDACGYTTSEPPQTDEAFRIWVIEALGCGLGLPLADYPFTLYRGATFDERFNGMYSFVPSRLADSRNRRFARPTIELPGYINPRSAMAPSGPTRPRFPKDAREQWDKVRNQVLEADCLLGVWFETPKLVGK